MLIVGLLHSVEKGYWDLGLFVDLDGDRRRGLLDAYGLMRGEPQCFHDGCEFVRCFNGALDYIRSENRCMFALFVVVG